MYILKQTPIKKGQQIQHFRTSNHSIKLILYKHHLLVVWLNLIMQFAHFVREGTTFFQVKFFNNALKHINNLNSLFLPQRHYTVFLFSGCLIRKHCHLFVYYFQHLSIIFNIVKVEWQTLIFLFNEERHKQYIQWSNLRKHNQF